MSFKALRWAFAQNTPGPLQRLVLIALAHHADTDSSCWPSMQTVERETRLSRSSIIRSMAALQEAGLIVREHTRRADGGQGANRYRLALPPSVTETPTPSVSQTPAPSVKTTPPSVTADTPIRTDNRTESSKYTTLEIDSQKWIATAKANGQPSPRITAYDMFKRGVGLDIDTQIAKFIVFNTNRTLVPPEWARLWERWCTQAVSFSRQTG